MKITKEQVESAVKQSGIALIAGSWLDVEDGNIVGACPLCQLVMQKISCEELIKMRDNESKLFDFLESTLDLPAGYAVGFVRGYDGSYDPSILAMISDSALINGAKIRNEISGIVIKNQHEPEYESDMWDDDDDIEDEDSTWYDDDDIEDEDEDWDE